MAMSIGAMGWMGSSSSSAFGSRIGRSRGGSPNGRRRGGKVTCSAVAGGSLKDQYRMLRLLPGASEKEVKKAFRQLALQYHPDVCKGSECNVQFHEIYEAYDNIISSFRQPEAEQEQWQAQEWSDDGDGDGDQFRAMCDSSWDMWEEWMGWEGAGIRDYSSHINPYI